MRTWFLTFIAGLLLITPVAQAGEKIAFISNRTGNSDIYVMNPDGSGQTNITNSTGDNELQPMWNADGSKLIFLRRSNTGNSQVNANIYTINADGSNLVTTLIGGTPITPSFVPNSSKISFSGTNGSNSDITTSNADGSGQTPITRFDNRPYDMQPRWNSSGSKFVFYGLNVVNTMGIPDIYVANADGSGEQRLTQNTGHNNYPAWRPDGNKIVFQSNRDGNDEIYVMNPNGTGQTRLTNNSSYDSFPVFSPDGSKIMFASYRDGNSQIYVMNTDGTNQTRITNNTFSDTYPIWTLTADENPPDISVNNITTVEGAANNHIYNFTATLSTPSLKPINVTYQTYDITATTGSDYLAVAPTTVTFTPGQTTKLLPVRVAGDQLNEPNETFGIRISAPGTNVVKGEGIATIPNDDPLPIVRIANLTVPEGNVRADVQATVTLSAPSGQRVSGKFTLSNGTAIAGSDYVAQTGVFSIPAGERTATIPVTVLGDYTIEPDETLFITLSEVSNGAVGTARATATLTNDDQFPLISIIGSVVTEGAGAVFTVSIPSPFTSPVSVKYATADDTAEAGSDYTSRSGTLTIPVGQTSATITVPTLSDSLVETKESFRVYLSDADNGVIAINSGSAAINDATPFGVYVSDVTIKEGDAGNRNLYFTIALVNPTAFPVNLSWVTQNGTATAGSDFIYTNDGVTMEANQLSTSVAVPIIADTDMESDETLLLKVNAYGDVGSFSFSATADGLATIVNDDVAPAGKSAGNAVSGESY